jgi:hypothetical protein
MLREILHEEVNFANYAMIGDVYVKIAEQVHPLIGRMWECVYGEDRGEHYLLREMVSSELKIAVNMNREIVEGLDIIEFASEKCVIFQQATLETCELVYIVHISYFMECRISFHAGMDGCFAIQGRNVDEDEDLKLHHPVSRLKPDMDRKSIHFRTDLLQIEPYIGRHFDIVHNIYCLRLRLLNGIQNGLKIVKAKADSKLKCQ